MAASDPVSPATEAVNLRVSDMINDVESEIRMYISEQRCRDKSHPAPAETIRGGSQIPSPEARSPISLDSIFDSPECRNHTPVLRAPTCQLRRRGATFHRVDEATADANDLRSRTWDREAYETATSSRLRSASDSAVDCISTLPVTHQRAPTTITSHLTPPSPVDPRLVPARLSPGRLTPEPWGQPKARSSSNPDSEDELPAGIPITLPSPPLSIHSASSQESLSVLTPVARPLTPRRSHPPSPLISSAVHHSSRPSLDDAHRPSSAAGSPRDSADMDEDLIENFSLEDENAWPDDIKYQPEIGRRTKKEKGLILAGLAEPATTKKPKARLPGPFAIKSLGGNGGRSVQRSRSVSRASRPTTTQLKAFSVVQAAKKEKTASKAAPLKMKRKAIASGFGGFFSGRMFQRIEVDEMIDIQTLRSETLPPPPPPPQAVPPVPPMPTKKAEDPDAPDIAQHPALRAPTPPPQYQEFPSENSQGSTTLTSSTESTGQAEEDADTAKEVASAMAEEEVALSSPPQIRNAQQAPGLPTILEVSTFQDDDKEALATPVTVSTTIISPLSPPLWQHVDPDARDLPIPVHEQPLSPPFLHGPIRLTITSELAAEDCAQRAACGSDDLDWTAFQVAISGPTGDYFMGGETDMESDDEDEDLVDWFTSSFDFPSEGRMIRSDRPGFEDLPDLEAEDEAEFDVDESEDDEHGTPVELPALLDGEPASGRTSATSLSTVQSRLDGADEQDPISPADKFMVSANLTDLGDFLSADMVHLAEFDNVNGF